jgi:hypothetical protein
VAERVGFVHARDAPKGRRGLTEDTLDAKTERSEGLAERVDSNLAKSLLSTTYGISETLKAPESLKTVRVGTIQER